jgi:hypothetical protein
MKQVKNIVKMSDVICENCVWYNEGDCIIDLPVINVEPDGRCGEGTWKYEDKLVYLEELCVSLNYIKKVEIVEDISCKNCFHYFPVREECRVRRTAIYRTQAEDWCGDGLWLYEKKNNSLVYRSPRELYRLVNQLSEEVVGESHAD